MPTNKEIILKHSIDTNTLYIGQKFKNRKEMSKYLHQDYFEGTARKVQTNEWKRYIDWETKGQQITITKIYDAPLPKIDGRENNGFQNYPSWEVYQVPKEYYKSKGVYAIILNKDIYIGSTTVGFLARYRQHANPNNYLCTLDMLNNGAVFIPLWIADDCTEENIRQKESEFISKYSNNKEWNIVNNRKQTQCTSHKGDIFLNGVKVKKFSQYHKLNKEKKLVERNPNDIRYLKIKHKNYDEAVKLLRERGLL